MKIKDLKSWALASTLLAGVGMTGPAFAQEEQEAQAEERDRDIIRVTGTRIQAPGVVSNSPISSIGSEEFEFRQPVAVEELVRTLPAANPAIGPGTNNGSGGGATISLRDLGSNRSLVLIDGRRVVPFTLGGSVDTNIIPLALIERLDLVTGGAGAVYGSDAISGVFNFILDDDFEGFEIGGQYGVSGEGDATRRRADVTFGGDYADGRGHAVFSLGYTLTDELLQGDRSFGLESLSSSSGNPVGSSTTVPTRFFVPAVGGFDPIPSSQIDPATGRLEPGFVTFNFNPLNFYQTPMDRYQAMARSRYELNDRIEVYGDLLYVRSDVSAQLAPSGTFGVSAEVPVGNPFIPQGMRDQLCANRGIPAADCVAGNPTPIILGVARRLTEQGPRLNDFEIKTMQYTLGARGDLIEGWTYDVYYQYGESDRTQVRGNWGSRSRVIQALNAVSTTECVDPSNGCVPLDLFGPEGSINADMLAFIDLDSILRQNVEQEVISASVQGDFFGLTSPFAANGISSAFGYEYRRVAAGTASDQASQIGGEVLGTGAPTPDRQGTFQLYEFFGEAFIPLIEGRQFAEALSLELGARYTDFRSGGRTDEYWTWKAGGEWSPISDLRFRTMFQRATRAPSVNELFAPQVTGLDNLDTDPCAGANPVGNAALTALCVQTGVPDPVIGILDQPSAGQVRVLEGGNPDLGPEVADTYTVGFVFQPSAIDGLMITLDYWNIEIEDAITTPSVADVMEGCYSTEFNPALSFNASCALINRSPLSGNLNDNDSLGIALSLNNIGFIKRDGVDLSVRYAFDLADLGADPFWGSVALGWTGTFANDVINQPTPASVRRQCVGYYSVSCGGPNPELEFTTRGTWSFSDYTLSLQWRYHGEVEEEPGGTDFLPTFSTIDAYNYFDLSGAWAVNDQLDLNLTIANLTDEAPPVVGNSIGTTSENSGNTFPQTYDVVGRYFTFGISARF